VQLSSYPSYYVRSNPTLERLTETVERLEEDTTDKARIHGRWHVILEVGVPIMVSPSYRENPSSLSQQLQELTQRMLDSINQGLEETV
jgi:hypothetical protein